MKKHFHYENNNIYKADNAILEEKQNGEQMQHTQLKKEDKRSPHHIALRDPLTDLPYQNRHGGYETERRGAAVPCKLMHCQKGLLKAKLMRPT